MQQDSLFPKKIIVGFCFGFACCFIFGIVLANFFSTPCSMAVDGPFFTYELVSDSVFQSVVDSHKDVERTGAQSGIVSHHLLVADKIAQTIGSLGTGKEKTVVVLSPNHFSLGNAVFQTTDGNWKTTFGDLMTDYKEIDSLIQTVPTMRNESFTFEKEHGVSAIAPFIRFSFPKAHIVPIAIHKTASVQQDVDLAKAIYELFPDAIIISSIDMSHGQPEYVRVVHDQLVQDVLLSGTCSGMCNLEIDSNDALAVLLEINRLKGNQEWNLVHEGSSLEMGATSVAEENTSHILGYFTKGQSTNKKTTSLLFVGDVMLDRGIRWQINQKGSSYPWEVIKTALRGPQIKMANLEGTVSERETVASEEPPFRFTFAPDSVRKLATVFNVVGLANNHTNDFGNQGDTETQQWLNEIGLSWFGSSYDSDDIYRKDGVSVIGFNSFVASEDELYANIEKESEAGQFVIVMPHWGVEYSPEPSSAQRELAKEMVFAGANLIIGSHPHVVQGIEMISGVPVVYSLGNFVFDQGFDDTDKGLVVTVRLSEGSGKIHLMPIAIEGGRPTLFSDEQAKLFLSNLSALSDQSIGSEINEGKISFLYE